MAKVDVLFGVVKKGSVKLIVCVAEVNTLIVFGASSEPGPVTIRSLAPL